MGSYINNITTTGEMILQMLPIAFRRQIFNNTTVVKLHISNKLIKIIFWVIATKGFDIMISFKLLTKAIVQLEPDEIAQWFYLIGNEYLMIYSNNFRV